MINKKEITGAKLKRIFGLNRTRQDYNNKNKSGGNFGISLYLKEKFNPLTDKVLNGIYGSDGVIKNLSLDYIRCGMGTGIKIPTECLISFDKLKDFLIIQLKGK